MISIYCLLFFLQGLSLSDAQKLDFYVHFKEAIQDNKEVLSEKVGVNRRLEFLESISSDIPKG